MTRPTLRQEQRDSTGSRFGSRSRFAGRQVNVQRVSQQETPNWTTRTPSYGGAGIRAVLSAGLSPTIGLFHHGRSNNFSLVDDLIEPFRPAVDFGVATLPVDADMSDSAVRSALVKASDQQFTETGLRISSVLEDLAQQFGQYVEGERARMRVLAWSGPHQGRDDIGR